MISSALRRAILIEFKALKADRMTPRLNELLNQGITEIAASLEAAP